MATLRDIKRRISSVKSTQQITKAMKMVAAAKLRRAQERLLNARPYAQRLEELLTHVTAQEDQQSSHPLLEVREANKLCYVVVTSDRGFCGGFNSNVIKRAKSEIDSQVSADATLLTVGAKGTDFYSRRDYQITEKYIDIFKDLDFQHASEISARIQELYQSQEVDRVFVVYNSFKSAGTHIVNVTQLLPLEPHQPEEGAAVSADYLYEPEAGKILDEIIPKNINVQIWRILLESYAAEEGARMVAMDSATENAEEMIYDLTLHYNKVRQTAITTQISEIVGGAEALRG
ncbi:ATP synthase F1 subunit gamma [candidate division KSB1 bacterium]|nr:ATP synthase F1 subunit gamma [candidate division KSB1 bacterium]